MGFISSLLCCSTPKQDKKKNSAEIISPSVDRKKVQSGNKNVNKRPKEQLPLKQSSGNKHNTLTDSTKLKGKSGPNARTAGLGPAGGIVSLTGVNVLSSSKRTMTQDEYSTAKIVTASASAGEAEGKMTSSGLYLDKTVTSKQYSRRNRGAHRCALGPHSDNSDKVKTDGIDVSGSGGYIEDDDLEDGDVSTDKETFFGDKRTVTVYQGETDTSTGSTDDDKQDCTNDTAHEVTAVLRGTRHSVVIDEDASHKSAQDTDCNDLDVEINKTDYSSDIVMDLAVLQPEQSHAPGYNTLLPPQAQPLNGRKCLVLDLDETLVHSSFKYLHTADFVIPVEIDNQVHNVYVIKRPGVDEFLKRVGELYEVVIFTASVSRYGDPLLDILDSNSSVHHRLFRDSCYNYEGNYIKNLSQIGRPLSDLIILDNSPASYIFHPQHAIPISSWFSDAHDNELLDILPLLEDLASEKVLDVGRILDVTI